MRVGVAGIGLIAPGIDGWSQGGDLLRGAGGFDTQAGMPPLKPALLPPNERRRTTPLIKLALKSAQDALTGWSGDMAELATVFSSSGGDLEIVDKILTSLGMAGKPVSPTHFHNSVHNAPAGYWSIASGSHAPSTSLSAFDASFSAGLLEAATQVVIEQRPVLLVAYDIPPPAALHPFRPLLAPFGTALLLLPADAGGLKWRLELGLSQGESDLTSMTDDAFENLRIGVPAARSLPMLELMAKGDAGVVGLEYLPDSRLDVAIRPC